ncbi:hypothetical protein [Yokenella regensburgei]|uniref:hypothetical protein n=1 Tax=Yokenella regensburgei TaxID=158877 RepID=UPI0013759FAB|nr:hypothetical protein [Yokenella regensburgei]KAF1366621.1 hypothetical protein FHR25_004903 [Yokenella regensburgei]
MQKTLNTIRNFNRQSATLIQSPEDFGVMRSEDGELHFLRRSDPCYPVSRIRRSLAAYGWRGERLKQEVERITTGPAPRALDIEERNGRVIYPYGWEKKELTREMRRMFPRRSGRRELIMIDELHLAFGG